MSQKNIKINIGGRVYPLTISENEEETIRFSQKRIDDNIVKLKTQYAIKDSQDLLAMTALEFATKLQTKTSTSLQEIPVNKVDNEEINTDLDKILLLLETVN